MLTSRCSPAYKSTLTPFAGPPLGSVRPVCANCYWINCEYLEWTVRVSKLGANGGILSHGSFFLRFPIDGSESGAAAMVRDNPANAPTRTEFRLGLFPPKDQGGKGQDKPQPPAPPKNP